MKKIFSLSLLLLGALGCAFGAQGYNVAIRQASVVTEPMLNFSDVTTANATTSKHGLLPKLSGNAADVLRGDGTFGAQSFDPGLYPNTIFDHGVGAGVLHYSGGGGDLSFPTWSLLVEPDLGFIDVTTGNASATKHGLLPKLPNNAAQVLRGDGTWSTNNLLQTALPSDPTKFLDGTGQFSTPTVLGGFNNANNGGLGGMAVVATSQTWVAPYGVTKVKVRAWGGGGAGSSTASGAAGGGGGGYGEGVYTVTPGNSYVVTVGAGGTFSPFIHGGASAFDVFLNVGGGRNSAGGSVPGAGGTASGANYSVAGQAGVGTTGGSAPLGGFGTAGAGNGKYPGGGGGGGGTGTAGAAGLVLIEYYDDAHAPATILTGSNTITFGSIAVGNEGLGTISVPGARVGDVVTLCGTGQYDHLVVFGGFVTSDDLVQVYAKNWTTVAQSLPSPTLITCVVFHH